MIAGEEHLTPYLKKKFASMKQDEVIVVVQGGELLQSRKSCQRQSSL